jgi:hypothetical protein
MFVLGWIMGIGSIISIFINAIIVKTYTSEQVGQKIGVLLHNMVMAFLLFWFMYH